MGSKQLSKRVKLPLSYELIRYLGVGVIVVSCQFAILTTLVELIHLNSTLSSAIAYFLATVINYFMQYHITFRSTYRHPTVFIRYFWVTGSALLLNVLIFWLLTECLGLWYLFSQCVAVLVVTTYNFILGRYYTFG